MGKKLTQTQIDAFYRDGFVSPVDVFTEEEAKQLRAELEAAEEKWPDAFEGAARNNTHLNIMCLDEIVHNPVILDAIEDLISADILNYGTVLFLREPNDFGFVSWHQDARYMGLEPHIGITAWVALTEANNEKGCMQMIPGSHGEIRDHNDSFDKENILTRGQEVENVDASMTVSTALHLGQMSIHSARVIHSSQPNRSNDRRIGFAIQSYIPPNVQQIISPTGAQLVRGSDPFGNFEHLPRPKSNMAHSNIKTRDWVNETWSKILYHGAKMRRHF